VAEAKHPKEGLLGLTIDQARDLRWRNGRVQYGGSAFVGHPLIKLDEELLDAMNYVGEARRKGFAVDGIEERIFEVCEDVRSLSWCERVWERKEQAMKREPHDGIDETTLQALADANSGVSMNGH
jgi:hypothetical protein